MGEKKCEQRHRMGDTRVKVEKWLNERGSRMRDTRVKVETLMIEKRLPNKRYQSESWKVKMWKEGEMGFLFSVYLPTCTVMSPSCTSFHLFLFILLVWCLAFLCLLGVVSFLTVAFVCPIPVPHLFLLLLLLLWCFQFCSTSHFFTFSSLLLCLPSCASFHIFFPCLGGKFMLQQPVCLLYLPWELVTSHTISYTIMHQPVAWRSSWTEWSLRMVLMGSLETSLTSYQCMLCNIPEEWRDNCWLLWLG